MPVVVWTDFPTVPSMTFIVTVDRGIVTIPPVLFFGVVPREMTTPRQAVVTLQRELDPFPHQESLSTTQNFRPRWRRCALALNTG